MNPSVTEMPGVHCEGEVDLRNFRICSEVRGVLKFELGMDVRPEVSTNTHNPGPLTKPEKAQICNSMSKPFVS